MGNLLSGILQGMAQGQADIQRQNFEQDQQNLEGFRTTIHTLINSGMLPADQMAEATQTLMDTYTNPKAGTNPKAVIKAHQDKVHQWLAPRPLPSTQAGPPMPAQTPTLQAPQAPSAPPWQPGARDSSGALRPMPVIGPPNVVPGGQAIPPMLQALSAPQFAGPKVSAPEFAQNERLQAQLGVFRGQKEIESEFRPDKFSATPMGTILDTGTGKEVPSIGTPKTTTPNKTDALVETKPGAFEVIPVDPKNPQVAGKIHKIGAGVSAEWTPILGKNGEVVGVHDPTKKAYYQGQAMPKDGQDLLTAMTKAREDAMSEEERKADRADARAQARAMAIMDARDIQKKEGEVRKLADTVRMQKQVFTTVTNDVMREVEARLKATGKSSITGPEFMQLLNNHMALTMGQVRGARVNEATQMRHIGARPWDQAIEAMGNKIVAGGNVSLDQARQWQKLANQYLVESWRAVKDAADEREVEAHIPKEIQFMLSQPPTPPAGLGGGGSLPPGWKTSTQK